MTQYRFLAALNSEHLPPRLSGALGLILVLAFSQQASAADWPQWRGPHRDAISTETGLLSDWPEGGPKLSWESSGVGTGYSSVAISQGRVLTLGKKDSDVIVTAKLVETGRPVWTRKIATTERNPCSTPTVDGSRVYVLGPDGDLVCLNFENGEILWQKHLVRDFGGKMMSGRGYGESPLIDGDRLIITPGSDAAAIVGLDKLTGRLIWQTKIPELGPAGRQGAGFSSIVSTDSAGLRQYVQLLGRGLVGIAAENGRYLWGYNAIANGTVNIPTPVVRGDKVFSANGYNAGGVLIRLSPTAASPGTPAGVKYNVVYTTNANQFQNHHGGVILIGEHLYGGHGSNNGLPTCLEFDTGKVLWKRRGPGVGSAAVAAADNRLYFRYQNGLVALLAATPKGYELHGTLQIPGAAGDSWPHPAISDGRLFLREQDKLFAYDIRAAAATSAVAIPTTTATTLDKSLSRLISQGLTVESLELPAAAGAAGKTQSSLNEKSKKLYRFVTEKTDAEKQEQIRVLTLTDRQLTAEGKLIEAIRADLQAVTSPVILSLAGSRLSDDGLRQITELKTVVGLNLEFCSKISDAGLASLSSLLRLRALVLTSTSVTRVGIKSLAGCPQLRALDLEVCDGATDQACEILGSFKSLQLLNLKKTGFEPHCITDAGLASLRKLHELQSLNLSANRITDAGLAHISEMKKLRELNLSLVGITDAGMSHLANLPELQHLELLSSVGFAGPKLTDTGVAKLAALVTLKSLDLTGAEVSDASSTVLAKLQRLQSLRVLRTRFSAAGFQEIQKTLPGCRIEY